MLSCLRTEIRFIQFHIRSRIASELPWSNTPLGRVEPPGDIELYKSSCTPAQFLETLISSILDNEFHMRMKKCTYPQILAGVLKAGSPNQVFQNQLCCLLQM